jgi:hypothetical protein
MGFVMCVCVCVGGGWNVWVFYSVGVCMCGLVMCGCVYVWVL